VPTILGSAVAPPGERFIYSNGNAHLLSRILQEATGVTPLAYAREKLFGPLGIPAPPGRFPIPLEDGTPQAERSAYARAGFAWPADRAGTHTGHAYLRLRPVDMLRLGQLYLRGGRWHGRQVVPEQWVEDSTRNQLDGVGGPGAGYGYLWWTYDSADPRGFAAAGYGGQRIHVVPELGLVVVLSSEADIREPQDDNTSDAEADALVRAVIDAVRG
jgi:CubicO group peptidase (beta-lactamase class C family)